MVRSSHTWGPSDRPGCGFYYWDTRGILEPRHLPPSQGFLRGRGSKMMCIGGFILGLSIYLRLYNAYISLQWFTEVYYGYICLCMLIYVYVCLSMFIYVYVRLDGFIMVGIPIISDHSLQSTIIQYRIYPDRSLSISNKVETTKQHVILASLPGHFCEGCLAVHFTSMCTIV